MWFRTSLVNPRCSLWRQTSRVYIQTSQKRYCGTRSQPRTWKTFKFSADAREVIVQLNNVCPSNVATQCESNFYIQDKGIVSGDNHSVNLANITVHYVLEPYSLVTEKAEIFGRFTDDIIWLSFGSDNMKDIRDTLGTAFALASLKLTFRHTSTMEADGSVEYLDLHNCVTPNEKYKFITKDFAEATAENRCFIIGLSHHPCSTFKSIVLGKAIRMRRLNKRHVDYQSALVRLRNKALRSGFSQNMVQDMIALASSWKIRLHPPRANKMLINWYTRPTTIGCTLQIIKHQRTEMLRLQRSVHLLHVVTAHCVEILVATEHWW